MGKEGQSVKKQAMTPQTEKKLLDVAEIKTPYGLMTGG
jgi:hypothetical protein